MIQPFDGVDYGPLVAQLTDSTAIDLLGALERREVSARELLDQHLETIDAHNPDVNAVITLDAERAADDAAAVDGRRAAGEEVGPLAGLPMTIKDALLTAGIRSTGGATELEGNVPLLDAPAVARLRDAGANVFGKTNLPRWSGDVQTYNEMFGTTNNPWDLTRSPGGSSGGAATAVAAGMTPFELGTDIGGSVRIPASNCGIYGHKPSFGVISTLGYLDHPGGGETQSDVNVFGPLARSIDDLEMAFDLLAGPSEPLDRAWRLDLPHSPATALGDFRVAIWLDDPFCAVDPDVRAVLDAAVARLEAAGARIEVARPDFPAGEMAAAGLALIGAAANPYVDPQELAERKDSRETLSQLEWHALDRLRIAGRHAWADFFAGFDVILCPVQPVAPVVHQHPDPGKSNFAGPLAGTERPYADLVGWTGLIGSAYLPSTVAPTGLTKDGLPIGVQIVGDFLQDRTTLAFARAAEDALGGVTPPPIVSTP